MKQCIALVTWDDAMMIGHWSDGPPDPKSDLTVYSVGFLVWEDKSRIVLLQSLNDGQTGNQLQIPRGMVRKIERIELV